ncbi:hypothetical protein GW17_00043414, partial [Ensete ventricosum]
AVRIPVNHRTGMYRPYRAVQGEQRLLRRIKETLWNIELFLNLVTSSSDERCSRLEKIDRLEIFQEYVRDLEREEEEQRKMQKVHQILTIFVIFVFYIIFTLGFMNIQEQLRRVERKNRDEFRKLMEEHVAAGVLTAKTHWRDYFTQVKDLSPYLAISSNTSGATPKDLFEDVTEELEKQVSFFLLQLTSL